MCRDIIKLYEGGQPGNAVRVEAARELVKVAEQATPGAAWKTAVAVAMLHEEDHHRFATDASYRVQMGRRVRHLAETNRGRYWHPGEGRFKLVYRDPSPRAALIIGDWLVETFGVAAVYFVGQDRAEAAAKQDERRAFHGALRGVAPGMAP